MDYLCGYCKKIHPELLKIVDERNDVRVFFIQHPILSENSKTLSRYVLAANLQNKGFDLHDSILSISGSITQKKIIPTNKIKTSLHRFNVHRFCETLSLERNAKRKDSAVSPCLSYIHVVYL